MAAEDAYLSWAATLKKFVDGERLCPIDLGRKREKG